MEDPYRWCERRIVKAGKGGGSCWNTGVIQQYVKSKHYNQII